MRDFPGYTPGATKRANQFLALIKYHRWSNALQDTSAGYLTKHQDANRLTTNEALSASAHMAYWFASLYVLVEGWQQVKLSDAAVDHAIANGHVDVLRRFRNSVFHYQETFDDDRFVALSTSHEVVGWALNLARAFDEFFQYHDTSVNVTKIKTWLFSD